MATRRKFLSLIGVGAYFALVDYVEQIKRERSESAAAISTGDQIE